MDTDLFNSAPQDNTDLFDIFNDNAAFAPTATPQLPGGACHYADLTFGSGAGKCGCRRFWARPSQVSPLMDQSQYCMCDHHACFHDNDHGARDLQPSDSAIATVESENAKPSTGRDPLGPLFQLDISMSAPPSAAALKADPTAWSGVDQLSFLQQSFDGAMIEMAEQSSRPVASIPDTLAWTDVVQPQPDANTSLPPIPPQCLMPSQATSTTSSVRAKYMRPFAGKGLHTLKTTPKAKQTPPHSQVKPNDSVTAQQSKMLGFGESFVVATPEGGDDPARPGTASTQIEPRANPEQFSREDVRNLTDIINSHAQRLEKLETVSFSTENHDECWKAHDRFDLDLTDLASRMVEVERLAQGSADNGQDDNASTVSIATSRASSSREVYSRLQSLQAQVTHLQSYLPSPSHTWEVEVAFLPFRLQRVWQTAQKFKDSSMSHDDDSTQLAMTLSASTMRSFSDSQVAFWEGCASRDHNLEWLLPRAFADKSITDKRLRSRGLIQKISVHAPDASTVQTAVANAFGSVFRDMQMYPRQFETSPRMSRFMGLQSYWVPLRKIHRDSRLRFLSPEEMLTPTLWNVEFLNSVMMKTTPSRLFITHPDAYVQDRHAYETGWTWRKLKEIASPCPDYTESQQVPEMEELEECWAFNEQLDEVPKVPVPVKTQRHERHQVSISPSVAHFPAPPFRRSMSPLITRDQAAKLQNQRDSQAAPIRMSSLPPSTTEASSSSSPLVNPKRRVTSHNNRNQRTTPVLPKATAVHGGGISKRRRTRSPSLLHAHFTPRRTASPSPMPQGLHERQASTTPYNYATPHSNAPLQELRYTRAGSVVRQSREVSDLYEDDDMQMSDEVSASDVSAPDEETQDDETSPSRHQPSSSPRRAPGPEPEHEWPGIDGGRSYRENFHPVDMDLTTDPPEIDANTTEQDTAADTEENTDEELDEDIEAVGEGEEEEEEIEQASDTSSQPSEYPTSQSAWPREPRDGNAVFCIHEDQ